MAHICLWLVVGAMLGSIPAGSLEEGIRWLNIRKNKKVLLLLYQLQRIPPYKCLEDRSNFKFPWTREKTLQMKKTQRTCLHHTMLTHILTVFATKHSFAEWDHDHLSEVLSILQRTLEELESQAKEEGNRLACAKVKSLVQRYFQGIYHYLEEKKYSSCAWEVVLVEMMKRLGTM
ncbi:unnamed protein product [Pipistrellus nathusii]|uniref:Uncharacterized protein n=1 Tax=Pipistrellus nathusii TaxID=59473 RepID=A0ABN9Z6V3_PIPNA